MKEVSHESFQSCQNQFPIWLGIAPIISYGRHSGDKPVSWYKGLLNWSLFSLKYQTVWGK
jgi:hypothetical protein